MQKIYRRLGNPALAGVIGSGVGLLIAVFPDVTTGAWRFAAVIISLSAIFYTLTVQERSISREDAANRRRFARESIRWAREVYNLLDEYKSLSLSLADSGGWDPELSDKIRRVRGRACSDYIRLYWIPLANFLYELEDACIAPAWVKEALDHANSMDRHVFLTDTREAMMKIEEMGDLLCNVAYGLKSGD